MGTEAATDLHELLAVQEHDRELDALRHRRSTLPEYAELEGIAASRAELVDATAAVRQQRHELERQQKRLEDEVAMIEARIATEDARLYDGSATGVKELTALQDEIAGLKKRQGLVEDQILEIMEAAEPLDAELAKADEESGRLDAQEDDARKRATVAEAEIDVEVERVQGERALRAAGVADEILADYERLRAQPGSIGVARLVGTTCHGCHLELAAVEVDRLRKLPADQLVHCEECGCILVR